MNGYERIHAALRGEPADTVPVTLHNFLMAAEEAGYTQGQYREDPEKIADSFIRAVEKYQYDGVLVDIDTVTLAGSVGVPVDFPEKECARSHRGSLSTIESVRDLKPVDILGYKYVNTYGSMQYENCRNTLTAKYRSGETATRRPSPSQA